MARRLQALIATLDLEPDGYRVREGDPSGGCPRSDPDAVAWELASATRRAGSAASGAGWSPVAPDVWIARVTLPEARGRYVTEAAYDVATNGPRTARTPILAAAGVRAWLGIELAYEASAAGTFARFRVWDVDADAELYWTGAEWAAGDTGDPDPATWNEPEDLAAGFPSLPGNVRRISIVVWLGTSSATAAPAFYGARVAYGVRWVSAQDDALIRTVLASLRDELRAVGVAEVEAPELLDALPLAGDPFPYQVTDVLGAWDLTADPDELAELPGTLADGTWTPDVPIPAGHVLRVEFEYAPDLVVRRHQDLAELSALPAVYVAPSGPAREIVRPQGHVLIRDFYADPPRALALPEPATVAVPLDVRIVAELGRDVETLGQALDAWIATTATDEDGTPTGLGTVRELVSRETGQIVRVQLLSHAAPGPAGSALGVADARAAWLLQFARPAAHTVHAGPLISESGVHYTTAPREA